MAKKKNKGGGVLAGPMMIFFATSALWNNEHRFNYAEAAAETVPVAEVQQLEEGGLFSHTEKMNRELKLQGEYVDSFVGYLKVSRTAEIYSWERDEDDDGVTWSLKWKTYVQNNERNEGLVQKFRSKQFMPPTFDLGQLKVVSEDIEFVDPMVRISPNDLRLIRPKLTQGLTVRDNAFYFASGGEDDLGDERITYRGLPVPEVATYFGKASDGRGVAEKVKVKEGFVNSIIGNKGVLHHLVAGEREGALVQMKEHLKKRKMIVRAVASVVNVLGALALFSFLTKFLYHIPIIGQVAQLGTWGLGLLVGISISVVTIGLGFVTSHPLVLAVIGGALLAGIFFAIRKGRSSQRKLKEQLDVKAGHSLTEEELKELQFAELVRLAANDGTSDFEEMEFLQEFGRKQGWDNEKMNRLIREARRSEGAGAGEVAVEDHVENLIHLALADGDLSNGELSVIRRAAIASGMGADRLSEVVSEVRTRVMAA